MATEPAGARTARRRPGSPQSKPIVFAEYGFASVDRCTNQPNVFYDAKSSESATPFWSLWTGSIGMGWKPLRDDAPRRPRPANRARLLDRQQRNLFQSGVPMILTPFCCAWNWDARPFPIFPLDTDVWGDGGNWATGNWIAGKGPSAAPPTPDAPPVAKNLSPFPLSTGRAGARNTNRISSPAFTPVRRAGSLRAARRISPLYDIELNFDLLRGDAANAELQEVIAFVAAHVGPSAGLPVRPARWSRAGHGAPVGAGDGETKSFVLTRVFGGFAETVQALIGAPTVYIDGVAQPVNRLCRVDPAGDAHLRFAPRPARS